MLRNMIVKNPARSPSEIKDTHKFTSLIFGILYSVLLFHERARIERFLAGGLMLGGVYLIAS